MATEVSVHGVTKTNDLALYLPDKSGVVPLTYRQLSKQLKEWIAKINLDPKQYTLHCLRRGGASWYFQVNVSAEAIRLRGNWASDASKNYIDDTLDKRLRDAIQFNTNIDDLFL